MNWNPGESLLQKDMVDLKDSILIIFAIVVQTEKGSSLKSPGACEMTYKIDN
jgi:hypothetical protein